VNSIETAIRLVVIGQEILIAAIFLFGTGGRVIRVSGALLMLSVAGYLYNSDMAIRDAVPGLLPFAMLLALVVPYCLWVFSRSIFEYPWPDRWLISVLVIAGAGVWVIFLFGDTLGPETVSVANMFMHIISLVIVFHALWFLVTGRSDDLVERRRTFRTLFVLVVAAQIIAVLVVELAFGNKTPPAWLEMANVLVIAALTMGLAIPLLRLNPEFFAPGKEGSPSETSADRSPISSADRVLRQKLLALMDAGYYRETGLSIRQLADELAYPEHQVRRLINGHLGFRNFSAFLNSYRIREAKRYLDDPERARTQVLNIALELGYASLGPFNRSFKALVGVTPTEYRQSGGESPVESE
jgi:AraC-like DNA-binding protein